MAFPVEVERETVEPHEEASAAEALYNQRLATRSELYERPRGSESDDGAPGAGSEGEAQPDEVPDQAAADRVSALYQGLREKARAGQLKKAVAAQATKAVKKLAIRLILPYLIPALVVIGAIAAIVGLAIFLTTMLPSLPGATPGAVIPSA